RALQSTSDEDFEVAVKFTSPVTRRNQMQGIIVQAENGHFLRYDVYSTGTKTMIFAAFLAGKTATTYVSAEIPAASAYFLRLRRIGNDFTLTRSTDGASWTNVASFTRAFVVSEVGLFAGNAGTNPTHTAIADWFLVSSDPIVGEDEGVGGEGSVTTIVSGPGSVVANPSGTMPCGTTVTLEAFPSPGAVFAGFSGDVVSTSNPLDVVVTRDLTIIASFVLDSTPPSVPQGLAASPVSSERIDLAWQPSTDDVLVAHYEVFRDGVSIGTVPSTSYSDTGLASGTTYSYTVRAIDGAGNPSALSSPVEATTHVLDVAPPTAPTGLVATALSHGSIELSWQPSTDDTGVAGYRVYRDGVLAGTPLETTFVDIGLAPETSYSYAVTAVDLAGKESEPSAPAIETTEAFEPGEGGWHFASLPWRFR